MNTTYLAMSLPFLGWAVVLTALAVWRYQLKVQKFIIPTASLLAATAVFDNLIIWSGLVAYDDSRILGLRIGLAPVEDFLYTIIAVMMTASLWHILGRRSPR